jgi:hypothetical protein
LLDQSCEANCTEFPPDFCANLHREPCGSDIKSKGVTVGCGEHLLGYYFADENGPSHLLSLIVELQRQSFAALYKENLVKRRAVRPIHVDHAFGARYLYTPQSPMHYTTAEPLPSAHCQQNTRLHWQGCCFYSFPYRW